jgi:hypothetical protein
MTELPRAELADRRPSPPVHQALRFVLGAGTQVTAALLALVLAASIHLLHKHQVYTAHTTARVLEYRVVGVGTPTYHVDVAYRDAAGSDHTGAIFVRGWPLKDTYPVDYDPEQPDRVAGHEPWYTNIVLAVVLLGFGNAALGGLAIAVLVGVQRYRAVRRGEKADPGLMKRGFALLVIPGICVALGVVLVRLLAQ